ncbi:hypothetical protein NUKP49_48860 [Klebsiella variicola]|nr:hypothetical protein NUKP49_48860 [Klebsiella variicola]
MQQIRNKLPYVIIILIEAQPGDTFPLRDHLLMPLRQQRGFAKSSASADDAQPALLNGTEKLKKPGALQQLYRGARRDEFGQD